MKIKELLDRYELKTRQSIYNWCDALGITLDKDSAGHNYATPEQIEKLDQLAQHLKTGGTLANFTPLTPVSIAKIDSTLDSSIDNKIDSTVTSSIDSVHQPIDTQLLGEMIKMFTQCTESIVSRLNPDPLWYMSILERACVSNWLLTTTEVEQLIGVKPKLEKGQKSYQRGIWIFVKDGKIGNQSAWRVMKQIKSNPY